MQERDFAVLKDSLQGWESWCREMMGVREGRLLYIELSSVPHAEVSCVS